MPTAAQIGDQLRAAVAGACKMLALEIARELKRQPAQGGTPVDTGHARRNWIPSVGTPNTEEAQSDAAYAQGVAQVLAYELANGALWIANVVPYIRRLNYGHSQQAPPGFVEMAIDRALATVQQKMAGKIDLSGWQSALRQEVGAGAAGNVAGAYSPFSGDD